VRTIVFSVSFTLSEYLAFVQAHAGMVMAERFAATGKASKQGLSPISRFLIKGFASVAFLFKRSRMPVCKFTIDEERIVRTAPDGQLVVPWNEVVAIHRYSHGYLVAERHGAVPLPFSCIAPEQIADLDALIQRRQSELRLA